MSLLSYELYLTHRNHVLSVINAFSYSFIRPDLDTDVIYSLAFTSSELRCKFESQNNICALVF
jgi:hypothetical protein